MKIKTVHIKNFRKLHNVTINMENDITVIAGANNCGKTSLIELFNIVFNGTKGKLSSEDYSADTGDEWSTKVFQEIKSIFQNNLSEKDKKSQIFELFSASEASTNEFLLDPIEVKIEVSYNSKADDIRNFSDYLMEIDEDNCSFYFVFKHVFNSVLFQTNIANKYKSLEKRIKNVIENELINENTENQKDNAALQSTIRSIRSLLLAIYFQSCEEKTFFTDRDYENEIEMDRTKFKSLFNFQTIMAGRTLDDESSDHSKIISKNMINVLSTQEDWKKVMEDLQDQIKHPIEKAQIREKVQSSSIELLKKTIDQIAETNGGYKNGLLVDIDVTDESIRTLLKNITSAKYQINDHFLNESSQGLGYSNLIYIHLQLEDYTKTINPLLVNFFVIEEPEAHMHPQMQNVFSQYLFSYFKDIEEDTQNDNPSNNSIKHASLQGILTTHSHEVVRNSYIANLRVLRQTSAFDCHLYDLREFKKKNKDDKDLLNFYDVLFTINFPDIIFAAKVILYEGDTERMLIKSLLELEEFQSLGKQYLSFVQVGGAYAHKYAPLLNFLNIKSAIITDIDYEVSDNMDEKVILDSQITNEAIKHFFKKDTNQSQPTVDDLLKWKESKKTTSDNIRIFFQGEKEGYARTLEEAMLAKIMDKFVMQKLTQAQWKTFKNEHNLIFTVPRQSESNIRDIVEHSSNNKTDFMYSVVIHNHVEKMLPPYIREALVWLV